MPMTPDEVVKEIMCLMRENNVGIIVNDQGVPLFIDLSEEPLEKIDGDLFYRGLPVYWSDTDRNKLH